MRSSRPVGRRAQNGQSGQSLVEALVAATVLGVGIVTALTALDTMLTGANVATKQAWATCAVRAEAGVLEAAQWQDNIQAYPQVNGVNLSSIPSGDPGHLQIIVVTATDSGRALASTTVLKAAALSSSAPPTNSTSPAAWCTYVTRAAP